MKSFKFLRNATIGGYEYKKGETYQLSDEHVRALGGAFLEGVETPKVEQKKKGATPKVEQKKAEDGLAALTVEELTAKALEQGYTQELIDSLADKEALIELLEGN